ncbi:MAG: diheme cytochrome c [Rhodospirillales bacterium]|nr:diheme cytochrome c [Rhodospirillales bacterium]
MKRAVLAFALGCLFAAPASADGDRFPPVSNTVTKQECGSCHMAFQPQFLPARSWKAIMAGLDNHFGENASIDNDTALEIKTYLVNNAADSGWFRNSRILRGVKNEWTPLRITELPRWVHEHNEEVPAQVWNRKDIGSKANCKACHRDADRGNYDDD